MVAPYPGVAVGLQFESHLVRHHVGRREISRRAEALVELAEERQIEADPHAELTSPVKRTSTALSDLGILGLY